MLSARPDGEPILLHGPAWNGRQSEPRSACRVLAPCCAAPPVLKWGVRKVSSRTSTPGLVNFRMSAAMISLDSG